jgi:hypothetical protein
MNLACVSAVTNHHLLHCCLRCCCRLLQSAAARSGRFFLYETATWSLRSWDTPPGELLLLLLHAGYSKPRCCICMWHPFTGCKAERQLPHFLFLTLALGQVLLHASRSQCLLHTCTFAASHAGYAAAVLVAQHCTCAAHVYRPLRLLTAPAPVPGTSSLPQHLLAGSAVTAAAWAPDASAVLLALSGSSQLVALYLVGQLPNLTEQLLPVNLPGVSDAQQ